ncbi:hypothetical protein acsn021_41120 [Anaerocolumna cellulosilytica]|uniref:Uncharacterized protein n=1 Tax=Anaerocolumna cellulosilytica TaxID=433286 RepID=A0A6S6QZB2_9FIRM|nr:hypothetical protein acsn021_41120 [Anaerocolumna cellulosilytica]
MAFWQAGWHPDTYWHRTAHVAPVWRECEKAPDAVKNSQNEGIPVGLKVVQVKEFMLLWQPKPEKHRPAKPFGDCEMT